ncbi:uncharacterized protein LOC142418678 [Mycteria americana]|uniref:uncharacterized protein LOC142418678 n=1 Tax=Mycteria americana TaxID=33587 RepID=UPI003F58FEDD
MPAASHWPAAPPRPAPAPRRGRFVSAGPAGEFPPPPARPPPVPRRGGGGGGAGPGRPRGEARGRPGGAAGGARELPSAPRPLPDRPREGAVVTSRDTLRGQGVLSRRAAQPASPPAPLPPLMPGEARGAPGSPPSRPKEAAPALGCRRAAEMRARRPGLARCGPPAPRRLSQRRCGRQNRLSRPADTCVLLQVTHSDLTILTSMRGSKRSFTVMDSNVRCQRLMEKESETYSVFYIELAFLVVKNSGRKEPMEIETVTLVKPKNFLPGECF